MKKRMFSIHLTHHEFDKDTAEKKRLRIDMAPSMMEWHVRDLRTMNGLR